MATRSLFHAVHDMLGRCALSKLYLARSIPFTVYIPRYLRHSVIHS